MSMIYNDLKLGNKLWVLAIMICSCSSPEPEMGDIESYLSTKYGADYVSFSVNQEYTNIDGESTIEKFILAEMINPEELISLKDDQEQFNTKIEDLQIFLTDSLEWDNDINRMHLELVEKKGFLLFQTSSISRFKFNINE